MKKEKLVDIEVDLDDDTFLKLAKEAHNQNITFNQLCVNYLEDYIKKCDDENTDEEFFKELEKPRIKGSKIKL